MTSSVLLVRMDIKNSQDDRSKVLWHLAADEKDANDWMAVMEFDHVELANDAGGGAGRGGTKYSESRLIAAKDIPSMRLAEMGQMNLGDLMSLFGVISAGLQAGASQDPGESIEAAAPKGAAKTRAPTAARAKGADSAPSAKKAAGKARAKA